MSALRSTRPTMRDVASRAGVSLKTVSRVINEEPGVAATTAARVGDAIDELGFQRNDLARSLRQGVSSATLGLVIEDVANPFYSAIAQAVEAAARERGFLLITASCEEDPERERELVHALLRRRVDALLLVPASREHGYLAGDTPVVFLDRPPAGLEADCVLLDNFGGARTAVEHLLAHGHRRIAMVGDTEELFTATERLAGYRHALEAAGVPVNDELIRLGTHDAAQAERVVDELLALPPDRRPTALFAGNNRNSVGALRALRSAPPVALVGFDDFELADLLATPATVVRHDSQRMGAHAAALAFARLDGGDHPPRQVIVPTELVVRGSGEIPPP
jgi:LacI family transcriptional regulator, galactose operon repressor